MAPAIPRLLHLLPGVVLLAACAFSVPTAPARLQPLALAAPDIAVDGNVDIRLSTGYTRTVPDRTRWRAAGMLAQGIVYQPLDTVFAIEGRNVHEAWLVVRDGAVQGFYLPAEGNFSPLKQPVPLPFIQGESR